MLNMKTLPPLLHNYLSVLIDDGRKYVIAKPTSLSIEVLFEIEREELAGYMLGAIIDTPAIADFYKFIRGQIGSQLIGRVADYCTEDSYNYGEKLLVEIKTVVRYYFENNGQMQQLLTDYRAGQNLQRLQRLEAMRLEDLEAARIEEELRNE